MLANSVTGWDTLTFKVDGLTASWIHYDYEFDPLKRVLTFTTVTYVPEPSTMPLPGFGLVGVFYCEGSEATGRDERTFSTSLTAWEASIII